MLCFFCCLLPAGVVMAKLGASVTATDLEPNLPLLRSNCKDNGEQHTIGVAYKLQQHRTSPDISSIVGNRVQWSLTPPMRTLYIHAVMSADGVLLCHFQMQDRPQRRLQRQWMRTPVCFWLL